MSPRTEQHVWTEREGYAEAKGRDDGRSAISGVYLHTGIGSKHHRQGRGRGGKHRPANLVSLTGDGTRGEHAWVEAHEPIAQILGYMVHSWDDPAERPIYRTAPFGAGYGWYLQDDDGQLIPTTPPTEYSDEEIDDALAAFEELRLAERRAAHPWDL